MNSPEGAAGYQPKFEAPPLPNWALENEKPEPSGLLLDRHGRVIPVKGRKDLLEKIGDVREGMH